MSTKLCTMYRLGGVRLIVTTSSISMWLNQLTVNPVYLKSTH